MKNYKEHPTYPSYVQRSLEFLNREFDALVQAAYRGTVLPGTRQYLDVRLFFIAGMVTQTTYMSELPELEDEYNIAGFAWFDVTIAEQEKAIALLKVLDSIRS